MRRILYFSFVMSFLIAMPFLLPAATGSDSTVSLAEAQVAEVQEPTSSPSASESLNENVRPEQVVADFEQQEPRVNNLGGAMGGWNMNEMDINNCWIDDDITEVPGKDGNPTKVMSLTYSVEGEGPSQNGFWTRLENFDARSYDHLEFDVKGDPVSGFTDRFKLELKKCRLGPCTGDAKADDMIKGIYEIKVTPEWQTVSIPLNKLTGLIDFSDPQQWKDPTLARENLHEFVIVFQDRCVTKKTGRIFIDNIRFVRTGNPGPTAVDFPEHSRQKTPTRLEGLEFQRFLLRRLRGFPARVTVKKEFPGGDREFLMEIARDTWKFFDNIVDREHALPLDTVQVGNPDPTGEGLWIGDYTNITNIGLYLMCLVSAYDLGFINRGEAVQRIQDTLATIKKLEYHASGFPYNYYDTTILDRTSYFVSLVDSGWLVAGFYVAKNAFPEELAEELDPLIHRGNFIFFYDPVERQMYHGYYQHLDVYADYHYGVFYTEPRAASYMAIARGEAPEEHWFEGLSRTFPETFAWQSMMPAGRVEKDVFGHKYYGGYYEWKDLKFVPSWGGSAFEALMPAMVLKEKELAPEGLGRNNHQHVLGQIRYAKEELGMPVWGMSPCSVPEGGYSEYGAKPLGVKGYKAGVVTPHASILGLEYEPGAVIENLRKLIELYEIYGEYGFYDAVDPDTGKVAYKYLTLDQGMILVALNNYLNDGAIRRRFHSDPEMQKAEYLLSSEKFFEPILEVPERVNREETTRKAV
ncbi:MAG: DUF3131 domain-containing protein, partial [Candidatus Omnitrophica bacterium]|nr:DUF3131 domain-containing protein [Candidatus Omnitrophota bacterium]